MKRIAHRNNRDTAVLARKTHAVEPVGGQKQIVKHPGCKPVAVTHVVVLCYNVSGSCHIESDRAR
ncbi:hypothetical protein TSUD_246660 [Trifolium subterraneum]|uniref:Uncharacterized protein n=1 Tax=Trifolium subterraneum TaxID=3900 RepID=A0A2Z6PAC8_TRISU|nr:hypothetical protein TSUD_246660 [Trifolium subterraneum]